MEQTPLFKIFWCVGDKVMEEKRKDSPVPLALGRYLARQMKSTTHTFGQVLVVPSTTDANTYKVPQG
jgi:hypothetical protein